MCGRRQSFLLSREGLDITALLETIANPRNEIALITVLRSALVSSRSDRRFFGLSSSGIGSVAGGLNSLGARSGEADRFRTRRCAPKTGALQSQSETMARRTAFDPDGSFHCPRPLGMRLRMQPPMSKSFLPRPRQRRPPRAPSGFLRGFDSLQRSSRALNPTFPDRDQGNCVQVTDRSRRQGAWNSPSSS